MKSEINFWRSLEEYSWKVIGRSPLPRYGKEIIIGLILIVLVTSLKDAKYSVVGVENTRKVVELAAKNGDYATAQKLWSESMGELEDQVFPERKVQRRIAELENKLTQYPSNLEIFLNLAELYGQLENQEMANQYREKARVLDPNEVEFQ